MDTPLEIAFHNMQSSDGLEQRIRTRAAKLERFHDHITSCHVVVEVPHKSQGGHKGYHVRIECRVPGKELVVSQDPGQGDKHDPYAAVNDAFYAMERRLEHAAQKKQGEVKAHDGPPQGRVRQLFSEYGFIETLDGRDIWFHKASVIEDGFEKLEKDMPVELSIVDDGPNGMGPQATSVRPIGRMQMNGEVPSHA
ncbi:HPF/RaiA family ribosome-associated protein [Limimaricola pyoseonensis]|uniref:Ribosomal subunit interface protein n=1 Tax=Limimaricola pyoseonensis TaxID=521013 RepID=A0A1G7G847_9RHOB|nr:HPF/RaiA family ribosome-associated protein [Limimaricola pyoseonensis]SDE84291.1 ribosomal subunit interface protein [Limimaricola pyoseonensis]